VKFAIDSSKFARFLYKNQKHFLPDFYTSHLKKNLHKRPKKSKTFFCVRTKTKISHQKHCVGKPVAGYYVIKLQAQKIPVLSWREITKSSTLAKFWFLCTHRINNPFQKISNPIYHPDQD
jgi:hypothetical protein